MAPACAGCGAIFCIARCPGLWNCVRDYSGAGQEINCPKPFTTACHMADVRFYSMSWPDDCNVSVAVHMDMDRSSIFNCPRKSRRGAFCDDFFTDFPW